MLFYFLYIGEAIHLPSLSRQGKPLTLSGYSSAQIKPSVNLRPDPGIWDHIPTKNYNTLGTLRKSGSESKMANVVGSKTIRRISMKNYMNEHQASEYTGISVHTLRKHRSQHKGIPYCKIGKSVRYKQDDIDRYMAEHTIL